MSINWGVSYRSRDGYDGAAPISLFGQLQTVAGVDTLAAMQAASDAIVPLVAACSQSKIVQAVASVGLSLPSGLPSGRPLAGTWNKNGGNIDYDSNSPGDGFTLFIPNILAALVQPGGELITNVAPLLALSEALTDQTAGKANYWTDEDRNFLNAFFWGSTGNRKFKRAYGVRPQRDRVVG